MRMIAGCILILAAVILASTYWLSQVLHNSSVAGSPEAMYLLAAAFFLVLFGGGIAALGLITDRQPVTKPER